ncbi:MAG: chitobiase/beta-hexosaminidase C-terminal domain-containing protein [Clostridia bacterium]|nr:chitobiase/beta-hexosaminidase C-terminal domain-containing protein [Clostridia bacterium]
MEKIMETYQTGNYDEFVTEVDSFIVKFPESGNLLESKVLPLLKDESTTLISQNDYEAAKVKSELAKKWFNSSDVDNMILDALENDIVAPLNDDDFDKCFEISMSEKSLLNGSSQLEQIIYSDIAGKIENSISNEDVKSAYGYYELLKSKFESKTDEALSNISEYVNQLVSTKIQNSEEMDAKTLYETCVASFGDIFDSNLHEVIYKPVAKPKITIGKLVYIDQEPVIGISSDENAAIYYTTNGTEPNMKSKSYLDPMEIPKGEITLKAVAVNKFETVSEVASIQFTNKDGDYYWLEENRDGAKYKKAFSPNNKDVFDIFDTIPLEMANGFAESINEPYFFNYNISFIRLYYRFVLYFKDYLELFPELMPGFREIVGNGYYVDNNISYQPTKDVNVTAYNIERGFASDDAAYSIFEDIEYTGLIVFTGASGYIKENFPDSDLCKKIDLFIDAMTAIEPNMTHKYFEEVLPKYLEENHKYILDTILENIKQ